MTTTLLKLAVPTEGSYDGTWGDIVNNGITEYLDIAVAGTTTLSADSDTNLTATEGDVSGTNIVSTSAQYAVLLCTGARTALRNINAPKQSKTYVVINSTTGGFGVTVRGGPSTPTTGVTIAAGEKAYVAWDGSDFVKVGSSAASGTVTSVAMTVPTGLSVVGSPITSSGTLAVTTSLNGIVKGNGSGFTTAAAGTDYAPATSGTSILYGNGSGGFSNVTIGSNLTFFGGTLSASAGSGLTGTTDSASPFKTALGDGAGTSTTGIRSTAVGYRALYTNATGTQSTAVGYNALYNSTGGSSTAVGNFAGYNEGTGNSNVAVGESAGYSVTTGVYNVSVGVGASGNATGSNNIAVGRNTLGALSAASTNNGVAVGSLALNNVQGDNNTAVGYQAGRAVSTGTNNTLLGYNAGFSGTNNLSTGSNNTLIGNAAAASANSVSNEITLGNSSIATLRCQVTSITSLSDARDKTDVAPVQDALKFVNSLNPVRFTWNTRDGAKVGIPDMGFIAQELKAVQAQTGVTIPNLVYESNPDRMEAAYGTLIPVLVKAIQELTAEVAALKAKA